MNGPYAEPRTLRAALARNSVRPCFTGRVYSHGWGSVRAAPPVVNPVVQMLRRQEPTLSGVVGARTTGN